MQILLTEPEYDTVRISLFYIRIILFIVIFVFSGISKN